MPSKRLNKQQKLNFLSPPTDEAFDFVSDRVIDPNDGKEFHEGMAAGLIVALDCLEQFVKEERSKVNTHSANAREEEIVQNFLKDEKLVIEVVRICLQRAIAETLK